MDRIPNKGRVVRVKPEVLAILKPYDTDANAAIPKMQKTIDELKKAASTQATHGCNFDKKEIEKIVKASMESVMAPFTGG